MTTPKVHGDFRMVAIREDSPGIIGQMAIAGMVYGIDIAEGETIDIIHPGTCVIETPEGRRLVAHIAAGTITGPARVVEVEDISRAAIEEEIERQRLQISRALRAIAGEFSAKSARVKSAFSTLPHGLPALRLEAITGVLLFLAGFLVMVRGVERLSIGWASGGSLDCLVGLTAMALVAFPGLRLYRARTAADAGTE